MSIHKSVLPKEAIESLNLKNDSIVVDATFGRGGHSREILKIIKNGKLIGIDADEESISKLDFKKDARTILVNDNFANLENILEKFGIEKVDPHTNCRSGDKNNSEKGLLKKEIGVGVDAILADLGWSSEQLKGKGMSFQEDEVLDMRLSKNQKISANDIVNNFSQKDLERIIRDYGEEKFWKNIARKIIEYRKSKNIETTKELAEIVKNAIPKKFWSKNIHPATKTFQALRIEVNQELENLKKFIPQAVKVLNPSGRLAIISFHSLEDRIVKDIFRENARGCICPPSFPQCICGNEPEILVITKKPIIPKDLEIKSNPRSRSAKLRVCEKHK
jgi:16S rRNA (cytosine1402-N4)-methyltransferase